MLLNPQWVCSSPPSFCLLEHSFIFMLNISHNPDSPNCDLTDSYLCTEVNVNLLSYSQVRSIELLDETSDVNRLLL